MLRVLHCACLRIPCLMPCMHRPYHTAAGSAAGGLATILNVDRVQRIVGKQTKVVGMYATVRLR